MALQRLAWLLAGDGHWLPESTRASVPRSTRVFCVEVASERGRG